jgi:hypothetical protein
VYQLGDYVYPADLPRRLLAEVREWVGHIETMMKFCCRLKEEAG